MIQWAWDDIFTPFITLSSRLATAVWHDLSKFRHNGNILKSLWQFLGERIWYNFETMWQKYNTTGPIFLVVSEWQNVIIAIWSHCLVDDGVIWLISLIQVKPNNLGPSYQQIVSQLNKMLGGPLRKHHCMQVLLVSSFTDPDST